MSFLKRIFGGKQKTNSISSDDLWSWFARHASEFHRIVKTDRDVDNGFLEKLMPRLQSIDKQFYCLTGMYDNDTAELIITAEGDIKSFVFVEELVNSAPPIQGWKFTALKPPADITSFSLNMNGNRFDSNNTYFYYDEDAAYPDEIAIHLLYDHYSEENKDDVTQGCLLFLENGIGELKMATQIDDVSVATTLPEGRERIPIGKLEEFLVWREKELVEKYEGTRHDTNSNQFSLMEAEDKDGMPLIAVVNRDLLEWDAKASHPWMMVIEIGFNGEGRNGMPDKGTTSGMEDLEDALLEQLTDREGYLNLGRQTYKGERAIFFACKEFRRSSKIAATVIKQFQDRLDAKYAIYKDKYWMSMERFR
jgi:hypothetical protein